MNPRLLLESQLITWTPSQELITWAPSQELITWAPSQERQFGGRDYIMEESITGDFALIKAHKADTAGNLTFRLTANNFNQPMASAGTVTIAEVTRIWWFAYDLEFYYDGWKLNAAWFLIYEVTRR